MAGHLLLRDGRGIVDLLDRHAPTRRAPEVEDDLGLPLDLQNQSMKVHDEVFLVGEREVDVVCVKSELRVSNETFRIEA